MTVTAKNLLLLNILFQVKFPDYFLADQLTSQVVMISQYDEKKFVVDESLIFVIEACAANDCRYKLHDVLCCIFATMV